MSQEARGLDAGARLASRLVGHGDARSAAIVSRIACEERAHVAVGVAWFGRLCGALGLDAARLYRSWLEALGPELLKVWAGWPAGGTAGRRGGALGA